MPLSTIFQLYHGDQFYCWRKPEYQEKPPTMHYEISVEIQIMNNLTYISCGKPEINVFRFTLDGPDVCHVIVIKMR